MISISLSMISQSFKKFSIYFKYSAWQQLCNHFKYKWNRLLNKWNRSACLLYDIYDSFAIFWNWAKVKDVHSHLSKVYFFRYKVYFVRYSKNVQPITNCFYLNLSRHFPLLRFIYKAIPKSTTIFRFKSRDFICLSFVYVFLYFWFIFIGKLRSLIVTLEHHVKDLRDKEARVSSCR